VVSRNLENEKLIQKIFGKNELARAEIDETGQNFKLALEKELEKIDFEFEELLVVLSRRKEELKMSYRNMIVTEIQKTIEDERCKINQVDIVLEQEKNNVENIFKVLSGLSDGSALLKNVLSDVRSSKENVEKFDVETPVLVKPHLMAPSFEMPESDKKLVAAVGKISYLITDNIYEPTICFFGDKNKIMAYKIVENTWELRQIDNRFEFNYYSASATLPNGSVLITGGGSSNSVFIYSERKVFPACPMNQIRKEHAAVFINNYVYAIGGYDGVKNLFLSECEKYCILSNKWTNCASMQVPRCAFSATSVNNKYIFIFGGYDGNQRLANIERYSPENDVWVMVDAVLKHQLSNCACFSPADNKVIVLGGGFSSGFSHSVDMLDVEKLTWTKISHMNEGRDLRNKLTYFQGGVYCVGGYNFRAEIFNLVTNTWTQLSNYPVSDNLDSWSSALAFKIN
jgi:kelch-like protein 10